MKVNPFILLFPLVVGISTPTNADESLDAGQSIYDRKCKVCHSVEEGSHRIGPSLFQVFQRPAGGAEGYRFSKSFAALDLIWDQENLAAFLEKPKAFVPGTKMSFGGVKSSEDIESLIRYLMEI